MQAHDSGPANGDTPTQYLTGQPYNIPKTNRDFKNLVILKINTKLFKITSTFIKSTGRCEHNP